MGKAGGIGQNWTDYLGHYSRIRSAEAVGRHVATVVEMRGSCSDGARRVADDGLVGGVIIDNVDVGHSVAADEERHGALTHDKESCADAGRG